jgi:hypothetical protein
MLLSELGSISINDGVGARDKRRESCKGLAVLRFLDGLSLDMMMIVKEDLTVGRANSAYH